MNQLRQNGPHEVLKNTLSETIDGVMDKKFIKCVDEQLSTRERSDDTSNEALEKLRIRIENLKDMLKGGKIVTDDTGNPLTNDQVEAMIEFIEYQISIREQFENPVNNEDISD